MDYEAFEIVVGTKDASEEGVHIAIVMGFVNGGWCNTGIVVHNANPVLAFTEALVRAEKAGYWN